MSKEKPLRMKPQDGKKVVEKKKKSKIQRYAILKNKLATYSVEKIAIMNNMEAFFDTAYFSFDEKNQSIRILEEGYYRISYSASVTTAANIDIGVFIGNQIPENLYWKAAKDVHCVFTTEYLMVGNEIQLFIKNAGKKCDVKVNVIVLMIERM